MHDKNGVLIEVGDKVVFDGEYTVSACYPGADFCQVGATYEVPGEQVLGISCQAKQLRVVRKCADVRDGSTEATS